MDAKAIEDSLAGGGSALLVNKTGTLAPKTIPAAQPEAKYTKDLYRVLPETISGTIMPSA